MSVLRAMSQAATQEDVRPPMVTVKAWVARGVDVIGDVHGLHQPLLELLAMLGYKYRKREWSHPNLRTVVFVGDLTDYGPDSLGVLRTVMRMQVDGIAHSCMGNHDNKLMRSLLGNPVNVSLGLEATLAELAGIDEDERQRILMFLTHMSRSLVFRIGEVVPGVGVRPEPSPYPRLVVAHAGLDRDQIYADPSPSKWSRVLYGNVDRAQVDDKGYLFRDHGWTSGYDDGEFFCAYGHTFVPSPDKRGNTINIDTGATYGGGLTAFRWPEKETVTWFTDHDYRAGCS